MGLLLKLILLSIPVGIGYIYLQFARTDPIPKVEDEFWGPKSEQGKKEDKSIRPFKIDVPASVIDDLKARLKRELDSNRLLPPLEGIGFEYGFNSDYLKTVGQYWLEKYDWRAREKLLNQYPHFKTKIGGLDIHFQHVKPKAKSGVEIRPLLLLHGWPGSIIQFQKIIPLLSEPQNSKYNYEVIIASLPGYGWSQAVSRRGCGTTEMANIFKRLMNQLGHQKFFLMGADWGALIVSDMAVLYPESIFGVQSAHCVPSLMNPTTHIRNALAITFPSVFSTPEEAKFLPSSFMEWVSFSMREFGYVHLQATKPDTVGAGLTHSPLGLAAFLMEKFSTWTNKRWMSRQDGGLLENFTMDELLDNVMVYWVTGSITSSQRLYSEAFLPSRKHNLDRVPTNVPFNCIQFAEDVIVIPEFVAKEKYLNLKKMKTFPTGGHFSSMEIPQVVADEAVPFFNSLSVKKA